MDFQEGIEFKDSDPTQVRKILRDDSKTSVRPYESERFKDATPFVLRSEHDYRFESDRYGWLAR